MVANTPKQESWSVCGHASLPVESGRLRGSRCCLLPGDLSRDKAANLLRLQIPQTALAAGWTSGKAVGQSREPGALGISTTPAQSVC